MTVRQTETRKTVRERDSEKIAAGAAADRESCPPDEAARPDCHLPVDGRTEEIYAALFREMLDGFALHEIVCDAGGTPCDYRFIDVNPAFERLTGLRKEAIIGRTVLEAMPETESHWITTYGNVALTGEAVFFENFSAALNKHFEVKAFRPAAGQFACIFSDITGRKQVETALRESKERFRALHDASFGGITIHDQGIILDCNQGLADISGFTITELVGMNGLDLIAPDWRELVVKNIQSGYEQPYDAEGIRKDGTRYNLRLRGKNIPYKGKTVRVTEFRDITTGKKAELELARLNSQLKAKNKELAQVVYVASHDLRSPLVNIDGYGKELTYSLDELNRTLSGEQLSYEEFKTAGHMLSQDMGDSLGYIRSSTAQMDALLNGLLKFSRFGRAVLSIEPLNMGTLMAAVIDSFQFQADEAGVDVHVAPGLPPCLGDAPQVNQLFSNLLGNALKFLQPERTGVIRIHGIVDGPRSVYCVADNGMGIDPAHQQHIFEIFHRLEPTKSSGEGLGLAIVQQISGRLGGEVWVESKPGEGSCFYVALPHAKGA